jgi:GntP family gluconate:H+ symporter
VSTTHHFHSTLSWTGAGRAAFDYEAYSRALTVRFAGRPDLDLSAAEAFRGDITRHNPEDLLLAAVSACHALTFLAIDGPVWVKALFAALPGGELGFLLFVDALIFILCCFIDFFEIAFILLPVLKEMEINLVWFGVMVALNLQTSFLTPPFGFALFYLRSVAPKADYVDKVTSRHITAIKTGDIYKGAVAFVALQLIMVAAVLWKPQIVLYGLGEQKVLDVDKVNLNITPMEEEEEPPPSFGDLPPAMPPAPAAPTN